MARYSYSGKYSPAVRRAVNVANRAKQRKARVLADEAEYRRDHPETEDADRAAEAGERGLEKFLDRIVGGR